MEKASSNNLRPLQNQIKATLAQAGYKDVYANKNGALIIKGVHGDAVKVELKLHPTGVEQVIGKFPQIGNAVQVVCTIILLIAFMVFDVSLSWLFAVLVGQLVSFIWFQPKIKQLKGAIESVLAVADTPLI